MIVITSSISVLVLLLVLVLVLVLIQYYDYRPVLIIASMLFFGTAVSARNGVGVVCALLGSYLYGRAVQGKAK